MTARLGFFVLHSFKFFLCFRFVLHSFPLIPIFQGVSVTKLKGDVPVGAPVSIKVDFHFHDSDIFALSSHES